jgi:hypothetical protein
MIGGFSGLIRSGFIGRCLGMPIGYGQSGSEEAIPGMVKGFPCRRGVLLLLGSFIRSGPSGSPLTVPLPLMFTLHVLALRERNGKM